MTVTALVTRNDITATASQTSFTYTFRVLAATDMDVYQNGVLLSSGYTVNNVGNTTGGTVVLDSGVPVGQIVSLVLAMPLDRTTNYQNSGKFLADDVNEDFDKIYIGAVQNENEGGRSLRLKDVEPPTSGVDMTIPLKDDRKGKLLSFNSVTGAPEASTLSVLYDSAAWTPYNFTGDGSTVAFTLGSTPNSENNTQVYIDGVYQQKDGYNVSGAVLTFSVAPPNLSTIEVMVTSALAVGSTSSDLVSYLPAGTGAVTSTVQAKLRESVSVKDFGAVGDGVTDDTAAIQAAVTASNNGLLTFPSGTYVVGNVDYSGVHVSVFGYGATIICTGTNGAFYKTDHGNKLTVKGITFTGATTGRAINHQSAQEINAQNELDIISCSFDMGSGVYGIYSVGTREARIQNCTFFNTLAGNGVYFKDSVSPFINNCTFRGGGYLGRGIYYPGTGTAFDAGLIVTDSEIMGWDKGIEVVGCDWLVIKGCTIDYCNQSTKIADQDGANISNNYFGSVGNTAALWIAYDGAGLAPNYSDKIIVINNTFTGHELIGSLYDCILIDGVVSPDNLQIKDNIISFYTRYGINFTTTKRIDISGNNFSQRSGAGVAPIYNATGAGDSLVRIIYNVFQNATTVTALNVAFAQVNYNLGCITESSGQTFTSGAGPIIQAHGLSYTPSIKDIQISPAQSGSANGNPYISAIDATNLTIAFTAASGGISMVWKIERSY